METRKNRLEEGIITVDGYLDIRLVISFNNSFFMEVCGYIEKKD